MKEELFRKSSLEKMTSLEKLDTYIKVTNPSAWLLIGGILLLLISAGIWSGAASLKTSVPIVGVVKDDVIHAFVSPEQAEELEEGMTVEIKHEKLGKVLSVGEEPVRREEAGGEYLTDYFRDTKLDEWNVEVVVSNESGLKEGETVSCRVVMEETAILKLIIE